MTLAPPSSLIKKSSTEVATKGGTKSNAFQESALTHSADTRAENEFLQLQITKANLLPDAEKADRLEQLGQLVRKETEQESLGRKILVKLNRLSDYDPHFAQISSVLGTTNRVQIAQEMAEKYCASYSTKRIMDQLVDPNDRADSSVATAFNYSNFMPIRGPYDEGAGGIAGFGAGFGGDGPPQV